MVAGAYNPAALEAEAGESLKPGEAEFAVSQDCAIALQPGQQEQNSVSKKKKIIIATIVTLVTTMCSMSIILRTLCISSFYP